MMSIPLRLDVDHLDDRLGLRVFVNGERQQLVRFYDIEAGFVERIMTDGDNRIFHINGEAVLQTVIGKVSVEIFELANA